MYTIIYHNIPSQEIIDKLTAGISAYAQEQKGLAAIESFAFSISDADNKLYGGCNGYMYYGCLYIDQIWVEASMRNQGWSAKLMQAAEELGSLHQCLFASVNTMDWEALGFYQKLGYEIEFVRTGYLNNSRLYFLRKDF